MGAPLSPASRLGHLTDWHVGDDPPSSPQPEHVWVDTSDKPYLIWLWDQEADEGAGEWVLVGSAGGGSVAVDDDGTEVTDAASRINLGTGLSVTDDGGGEVTIDADQGAYAETVGDGTETTFDIDHDLGTSDVQVAAIEDDEALVHGTDYTWLILDADTIRVVFTSAPAADDARVVVLASGGANGSEAGFTSPLLHVRDEKAAGSAGGSFSSGAWRTRTLNATVVDEIAGASLSSNQLVLPAGDYFAEWSAPAYRVGSHMSRLHNVTGSVVIDYGGKEFSAGGEPNAIGRSNGKARFSLSGTTTIELQHRCGVTNSGNGFGAAGDGLGVPDIFSQVWIWKVS